jgi:all-trans-retinol dehydrogenase (NAD+)
MDNLDKLTDSYNPAVVTKPASPVDILANVLQILPRVFGLVASVSLVLLRKLIFFFVPTTIKDIKNQVVLVTGGANGLGKALSLRFAAKGAHIAVADLDVTNAELLANQIEEQYGVKAFSYKVSMSDYYKFPKIGLICG